MAPTACRIMVSGTISLSYSEYFSPFPYGTGSLSVSKEYLALPDGTGRFTQDFSGPVLLRILLSLHNLRLRDYHPLRFNFPEIFCFMCFDVYAVLQPQIINDLVWAVPFSLSTTGGISIDFLSSRYLDVSVPGVSFLINQDNISSIY